MMEENKDSEKKSNQVAVRIHISHEDPILPEETLWLEAEHWGTLYSMMDQELINRRLPTAEVNVYTRWMNGLKNKEDWTWKEDRIYVNPFGYPEYMFLTPGDMHWMNTGSISNRLCIHIPSGTIFHIFSRGYINFGEDFLADRRNILYKFTYTGENGTVTPMVIHTHTKELPDEKEREHIKYNILKNGAKWFCEHLFAGNEGYWLGDKPKMNLL